MCSNNLHTVNVLVIEDIEKAHVSFSMVDVMWIDYVYEVIKSP